MKDYKIYLCDNVIDINLFANRLTNIDLVTKSRLTECDLSISSIPFREAVEVYNAIIIESSIENTYMQGYFSAENGISVHADIDQIVRNIMERGANAIVIDSKAELVSQKILSADPNVLTIRSEPVEFHAEGYTDAKDAIVLLVEKLDVKMTKTVPGTQSALELRSAAETSKQSFEQTVSEMPIWAGIEEVRGQKFESFAETLHLDAKLQSLCYQLFSDGGKAAMEPHAEPLDIQLLYSLGGGDASLALNVSVSETEKTAFIQPKVSAEPVVFPIQFLITYAVGTETSTDISAAVSNLCYHYFTGVNSAAEITAAIGELEEHFPLGGFDNTVQLNSAVGGHFLLEKRERADYGSVVSAECETFLNGSSPELTAAVVLGCAIKELVRRYRLLSDIDSDMLNNFDSMTLDALDYVIL